MQVDKIFLRNVGSFPPSDLEVKLFSDGEVEFYTRDGHINIAKDGVVDLMAWLNAAEQGVHWTVAICAEDLHTSLDEQGFRFCGYCGRPLSQ
jgi:hypothetical protein